MTRAYVRMYVRAR